MFNGMPSSMAIFMFGKKWVYIISLNIFSVQNWQHLCVCVRMCVPHYHWSLEQTQISPAARHQQSKTHDHIKHTWRDSITCFTQHTSVHYMSSEDNLKSTQTNWTAHSITTLPIIHCKLMWQLTSEHRGWWDTVQNINRVCLVFGCSYHVVILLKHSSIASEHVTEWTLPHSCVT